MQIFGDTNIGCVRKINQDYYTNRLINPSFAYSIVCDGMGGIEGGEIASRMAAEYIEKVLNNKIDENLSDEELINLLDNCVKGANSEIFSYAMENQELKGMGTTAVVAVAKDNKIYGVSDGDSRLYKINTEQGTMEQITNDHTLVQILLDKGQITAEQAKNHPKRHIITRALGVDIFIETDAFETSFDEDEIILICSDGLYNYANKNEIIKKTKDCVQLGTVKPLIDAARANGGGDNITAVIITHKSMGGTF